MGDVNKLHRKDTPTKAPPRLCRKPCLHEVQRPNTQKADFFGAPDELMLKPTPMPQTVITTVMNSNEGKQAQADALAKHTELDPVKLLTGTTVQLSNSASRIFIVMGNPPLSGGDNTWFWIVQDFGQKTTVLLWAGANCLNIESTKTHRYRDVHVEWSSAAVTKTEIYKFDGSSYKLHGSHWHENKN